MFAPCFQSCKRRLLAQVHHLAGWLEQWAGSFNHATCTGVGLLSPCEGQEEAVRHQVKVGRHASPEINVKFAENVRGGPPKLGCLPKEE